MQYLLLIYENEKKRARGSDPALLKECQDFNKKFSASIKGANALQDTATATTVRVREGKRLITDGPFVESKEQLGGYYLIEAPDLNQAIEIASQFPIARWGSVEIRPIMTVPK
jgi:hypothetical protein